MPLELSAAFPRERILYEDPDLVVVDKPAFVATHAPERSDDMFRRIGAHYADSTGAAGYLGVHQRLERDTSGVLVLTRRREANRVIAEQMERRRVSRTFFALVNGTPGVQRGKPVLEGVFRHRLVPEKGGAGHRVLPASGKAGDLSTVAFRVVERKGEVTLLALTPEPGCPVDLGAQLAAENAPIVGDMARGGAPAFRLMLHLAELSFLHPQDGQKRSFQAPLPSLFRDILDGTAPLANVDIVERRLREAALRRAFLARQEGTDAYRLVNADGDGLPGLTVDRYGEFLVVSLYDETAEAARETILDAAFRLQPTGIYLKNRPKHASRIVDGRTTQFAPKEPVRGVAADEPMVSHELGLPYETRLGDGLSTGIFLDQRENRRRVREMSKGAVIANLFAYTCPFTVAAAAGHAKKTVSVDVSRSALEWARRNLDRIGADPKAHLLLEADAIKWLEKGAEKEGPFDLIILDPPSFATTKQTRFSAESDYKKLAALAMRRLSPLGKLLACTNHKGISRAKLRKSLDEAAREAGRVIASMKDWPDPEDFPPAPGAEAHLKTVLVMLQS